MSPAPGAIAGPLVGGSFLTGVAAGLAVADVPFPRPGADAAALRAYYRGRPAAARISATGQLVSTAALARLTTVVARTTRRRWLRAAAAVGGTVAVGSLATSALTAATLTRTDGDDELRRGAALAFAAGGPVHGVGFGLLTGALVLAGGEDGRLPRPAVVAGLAAGAAGIASPLWWLRPGAVWLVPAGRFPGLVLAALWGLRSPTTPTSASPPR
ncbi:hypothetical protein ACR9E3_21950 [Actinomycetospora sp. C-140]